MTISRMTALLLTGLVAAGTAACGGEGGGDADSGERLTGTVQIDGSSTVAPVSSAIAEEFQIEHPGTRVTVGISGTGGGFSRFCAGETDISDASRPITDAERERCTEAGIEMAELPVAWDGLSVLVNPANDFVECLTMEELRRIWEPGSGVRTWRDVRSEWPAEAIRLYGPGTDSGTFDYFTDEVMGESGASRTDFQASEDDNVLVQGVAGDRYALGYFGYAYYAENRDRLRLLALDGGEGCVSPTDETIEDGSYPLARPIFIYVRRSALERPVVREFVRYYMENAPELVPPTGYHPLSAERYEENLSELDLGAAATTPPRDHPPAAGDHPAARGGAPPVPDTAAADTGAGGAAGEGPSS